MPHTPSALAFIAALGIAALGASGFAATIDTVDLDSPGAQQSFSDSFGALYSLTATQPAGSGVFLPFVRIQNSGNEQGYNSGDTKDTMDDINLPGVSSYVLAMNNVVDNSNNFQLTLDYNEPGNSGKSPVFLEDLVIVISTDADKIGPAPVGNKGQWTAQSIPMSAGDVVAYDMAAANNPASSNGYRIALNADANSANGNGGSGAADLNVTVPLLANLQSLLDGNHFAYIYSRFSGSDAGFEEWSSFEKIPPNSTGGAPVPEPASIAALFVGTAALLARRRR